MNATTTKNPMGDFSSKILGKLGIYNGLNSTIGVVPSDPVFLEGTDKKVEEILTTAAAFGSKIRIFYGNPATGRCWMDDSDVFGQVAMGSGVIKTPVLMTPGENFGVAIKTNKILKIVEFNTRINSVEVPTVLFEVPNFSLAEMVIQDVTNSNIFKAQVLCDGSVFARFETKEKALNWVAFMEGKISTI